MSEKKRTIDKKKMVCVIVFVLLPLIAVMVYPLLSGTSFFRLDAYMAKWNDERNYFSKVQMIHDHFSPQGINGYNESVPKRLGYGVYRPQVFVMYALFSLVTGVSSHNFMYYCNILMAIVSNALVVVLAKPDPKKLLRMSVFMLSQVVYLRYCVSGMSETNNCMFAIFAAACSYALWDSEREQKRKKVILFLLLTLAIMGYGLIRPQHLAYMLIPILYIWLSGLAVWKKAVISLGNVGLAYLTFVFYRFTYQWHSAYYPTGKVGTTTKFLRTVKALFHGEIKPFLRELLFQNRDAVLDIQTALRDHGLRAWVMITFLILICGLTALAIADKKHRALCLVFLAIGIFTYEATVFLYSSAQLHRMMLAYDISTGYLICMMCGGKADEWVDRVVIAANVILLVCIFVVSPSVFKIPQAVSEVDEAKVRAAFSEVFERAPEGGWYNTVAACSAGSAGTVKGSIRYMLPSYMGYTSCQTEYLEDAIDNDTVKARYIYTGETSAVKALCDEKYELLWSDHGLCVYRTY